MFKPPLRFWDFLILVFFMPLPAIEAHATSSGRMPFTLFATLLQPDGSPDLNTDFSGSLDAAGWELPSKSERGPCFVHSTREGRRTYAPELEGDEKWSAQRGLDNLVSALVPKGNDLYVAGQLITAEA